MIIKNKKTSVFVIFLAVSSMMWLLIKFSKEYTISIEVPVVYKDLPVDKVLINKTESIIYIEISDFGFELIGPSIFGIGDPISLSEADFYKYKTSEKRTKWYLLPNAMKSLIQQNTDSKRRVDIMNPDSLILIFEEKQVKKVKIVPNISLQLAPQYQFKKAPRIQPDSVLIYGSVNQLNSIDSIQTPLMSFQNIDHSIQEELTIVLPSNVEAKSQTTMLFIEVEKFTEAVIEVPIGLNFMNEEEVKIFPETIKIRYTVSLEDFHKINESYFNAIARVDTLSSGMLDILLQKYPENIQIIDYSPKVAEYIILK